MAAVGRVLDCAADGHGCVLAISGPPGSGRTELAAAAAREAARRGFTVLRTAAIPGQPGALAWARLLADAGASGDLASRVLDDADPLALDNAARVLSDGDRRLLVIDDIDHGGNTGLRLLEIVAARAATAATAVVVTSVLPVGVGTQLRLSGLSEDELATALPDLTPQDRRGVWLASAGLPGVARTLAAELAASPGMASPLVQLALSAPPQAEFLDINTSLIRLLELALPQAPDDATRARLLGRLARELLADSSAAPRRRALTDEAVKLARATQDPKILAELLDARLNALWDPAGAEDRLAAASEIIDLARVAGDGARERDGMFWRFVALMELARVAEAESALAAFHHAAAEAGDARGVVMATARQAMLANLRGRFGQAAALMAEVAVEGQRAGLRDTYRVVGTTLGEIAFYCGPQADPGTPDQMRTLRTLARLDEMQILARRLPGHLMEAGIAVWLTLNDRTDEAQTELDRILPAVLAGSGPRQLGSAAGLAFVATQTGDVAAGVQLREALLPYRERLAMFGGAAMCIGPVSLFLGLLATQLGLLDEAVQSLEEAVAFAEQCGALPCLALSLAASSRALSLRQAPGDRETASACQARSEALAGRLGMTGTLSRRIAGSAQWSLRRDGDDWLLRAGSEHARLRDSRGLHYLRALLAAPGSDIPALDLAAGQPGLAGPGDGPLLDDAARDAYRDRIRRLDAELAAADRSGDSASSEQIENERRALAGELRRATGLAGRRRLTSAEDERARVNVTRTLRAAIARIARDAPITGAYLESSVRTGIVCRYQPGPGGPDCWRT